MASHVSANVFDMMNDLDDVKSIIPEGLYINLSNLLKAEYNKGAASTGEPVQLYRVVDTSDDELWQHILLNADGEYNPDLQTDDDNLYYTLGEFVDRYVSNLTADEVKYYIELSGHNYVENDEEGYYRRQLYGIIREDLDVEEYNP